MATIAENLTKLQAARTNIANAITAKGGTVASGDGFEDFPDDIASITNTYTASDEGKVVSNGVLVAQTSDTVTQNGTVDTTLISSLLVNVSASGGGAAYYTKFPRTSSAYGKLGFGIVGNKGEQGTIFMVNIDGVSPDSTSYNTVQLNDLNLSDYLSQDKTVTMYASGGNYFYATFDIENNAIVFSKGNFMSTNTGYYATCVSTTL